MRKTTVIGQRKIISKCRHILGVWQSFLDKIGNLPEILWAHLDLQEIINMVRQLKLIKVYYRIFKIFITNYIVNIFGVLKYKNSYFR